MEPPRGVRIDGARDLAVRFIREKAWSFWTGSTGPRTAAAFVVGFPGMRPGCLRPHGSVSASRAHRHRLASTHPLLCRSQAIEPDLLDFENRSAVHGAPALRWLDESPRAGRAKKARQGMQGMSSSSSVRRWRGPHVAITIALTACAGWQPSIEPPRAPSQRHDEAP